MKSRDEIGILSPICPKMLRAPQDTKLNSFPGIVESEMGKKIKLLSWGPQRVAASTPLGRVRDSKANAARTSSARRGVRIRSSVDDYQLGKKNSINDKIGGENQVKRIMDVFSCRLVLKTSSSAGAMISLLCFSCSTQ